MIVSLIQKIGGGVAVTLGLLMLTISWWKVKKQSNFFFSVVGGSILFLLGLKLLGYI
ncbi:MAG: hypothetical protein J7K98_01840 [Candidatus Aenigmarchaeota archaeon]|nr:hypothetical protein [Candidatus Aenigmarchaeota archaeon]